MNWINERRMRPFWMLSLAGLLLALVTGCGPIRSRGASADEATPTPVPTPIVPEKPTYMVQVGTVVETLEFTGRASAIQEQELFFETNGNVSEVYVARGDWVKAGDVLAELEISDLQKQLAQKQINLETARLRLEQAQIQATEAITTTRMKLDEAKRNLQEAKLTSANELAAALATAACAETSLANAKLNLTIVQNSDVVVKNVRDREYEAAWWEAFYGECLKKKVRGWADR